MGLEDYISEKEAATIAGVSVATLNRFVEAGYLKYESDADGLPLISKQQLAEVFGIYIEEPIKQAVNQDNYNNNEIYQPKNNLINKKDTIKTNKASTYSEKSEKIVPFAEYASKEDSFEKKQPNPRPHANDNINDKNKNNIEENTHYNFNIDNNNNKDNIDNNNNKERLEIIKLKNIVKMLEEILNLKESQIKDLKTENNWLKNRIEKLEERSDRDQLLILSNTQLLRQSMLIRTKRSPIRAALEWLGIISRSTHSPFPYETIDIKKQNNGKK